MRAKDFESCAKYESSRFQSVACGARSFGRKECRSTSKSGSERAARRDGCQSSTVRAIRRRAQCPRCRGPCRSRSARVGGAFRRQVAPDSRHFRTVTGRVSEPRFPREWIRRTSRGRPFHRRTRATGSTRMWRVGGRPRARCRTWQRQHQRRHQSRRWRWRGFDLRGRGELRSG